MRNAGLGSWTARRAIISPDRPAIVFGERVTTYAELHERVCRLASRLRAAGVEAGDRVAYLGPNHPAFVETMFATYVIGGIFVPLNFRLTAPEIDYQLRDSGARVLVHGPECAATVQASTVAGSLLRVVPLSAYEQWLAAGQAQVAAVAVSLDEPACVLYTSGTTGRPKGAVLTHGNVVWNCYNLLVGVDVAGDEVTLISAPLFHVAALNQCLLPTVLKGGCSVIMPAWGVDECFDLIARHRVTWMFGVTTMYADLARSPRWESADLTSVRNLIVGGAALPEGLIRIYLSRALTFCQGYGMTETAPGATFLEAPETASHVGSAGVPVFFADVRCVRPDHTDVEPGEPGEVQVRGPNVTPGYWGNEAATAQSFADDGWFRTGDIAVVSVDGHYRIVDRLKDMFVSGGENVYPAEVEAAIFEHPGVAEAAVIGVPDEKWGEVGRAFVVLAPGHSLSSSALQDFLTGRLARFKIPRYVDVVDGLPRTGSNKVRKAPLREIPLPS
ncbi:long-chain fatty acid--CoA ligase [Paractinoplanes ferrugineus]|uniref:Fatty-acyl-CoA synthase n=1 Tax=Paractinoplanes ferrugineus TaxID=113564 RepID=A0A919M983_9ACTN|nr:long-chain fatty acid--CoA ligase [Actinoplanes ferrugineus]GIE11251.1 fatty-acyl-CoA synthase [Actinoplanes ferrugineus]